jgi:starch synthase
VLFVGSEATPYAKTGGLADVLGALPSAIARLGWDVTLVLPRYRGVEAGTLAGRLPLIVGANRFDAGLFEDTGPAGVRVLLLDIPELYDRAGIYGIGDEDYPDNARRFAVLARAALEWATLRGEPVSVVHAHDWQAGLVPVYLRLRYPHVPVFWHTPTVFTIHNLAFQGLFEADWLPRLDLPWDLFALDRMEYWGRISFLKGAINEATLLTVVSRTYAKEIQTPELGCGFDGILRRRADDLIGILNGIDTAIWNPEADESLPAPYSSAELTGKRAAKAALLSRFGLPADEAAMRRLLVGMVSRMVDQKGLDLIAAAGGELGQFDAAFVVLGTGEARYEQFWRNLAARHPTQIAVHVGFDEELAHLIEGGADAFLMPSRFEPCGLNQMYSLRYGTVPIVRAVGGLADTVIDYSPRRRTSNGIVFREYSAEALLGAIRRAVALYRESARWRALQVAGMKRDYSWDHSARQYVKIYDRAMKRAAGMIPVRPA